LKLIHEATAIKTTPSSGNRPESTIITGATCAKVSHVGNADCTVALSKIAVLPARKAQQRLAIDTTTEITDIVWALVQGSTTSHLQGQTLPLESTEDNRIRMSH
jgi:hypothetical protein